MAGIEIAQRLLSFLPTMGYSSKCWELCFSNATLMTCHLLWDFSVIKGQEKLQLQFVPHSSLTDNR